jgi:hypothetical protein
MMFTKNANTVQYTSHKPHNNGCWRGSSKDQKKLGRMGIKLAQSQARRSPWIRPFTIRDCGMRLASVCGYREGWNIG